VSLSSKVLIDSQILARKPARYNLRLQHATLTTYITSAPVLCQIRTHVIFAKNLGNKSYVCITTDTRVSHVSRLTSQKQIANKRNKQTKCALSEVRWCPQQRNKTTKTNLKETSNHTHTHTHTHTQSTSEAQFQQLAVSLCGKPCSES